MLARLSAGYRHRARTLAALVPDAEAPDDPVAAALDRARRTSASLE